MIKHRTLAGQKGFTVLELTMAAALTALFAAAFYTAFYAMNTEMWRNKNYFDNNTTAKNMLDRISTDVKEALTVEVSHNTVVTGNTSLALKLPSINAIGEPTGITTQFDYVIYRLSNRQLLRSSDVSAGVREGGPGITNSVVGMSVSSIQFSKWGKAGDANLGDGLSVVAAAGGLAAVKVLRINITTQTLLLSTNQTSEVAADVNLMTGTKT